MSSVQSIAVASLAAFTAPRDAFVRNAESAPTEPARADAELRIPVAFTTPRADRADHTPAIPEALDIKNIQRANPYADAFGMAVDPTKDIALEGAPGLFARYADQVGKVIDRIYGAEFKALLDVKV